jgi:oligopeptide/dipeptide ABC transporter ATP-binding protein
LAIVGESGCGKSVSALSVLRLLAEPPARISGCIKFDKPGLESTLDLLTISRRRLRRIRGGEIAMVFQDPLSSLNPVLTVGDQIIEMIRRHQRMSRRLARARTIDLLRMVGIPSAERRVDAYPHELSGGMRQRVMIAMAISCEPAVLIADEPTTKLDVTIQAQILDLLGEIQRRTNLAIVLITHDLAVVSQMADRVCVMYSGRIVESGPTAEVLQNPKHPYTQGLLRCIPDSATKRGSLRVIPGQVPSPIRIPQGCRFHPRCELTQQRAGDQDREVVKIETNRGERTVIRGCVQKTPQERSGDPVLEEKTPGHSSACWET